MIVGSVSRWNTPKIICIFPIFKAACLTFKSRKKRHWETHILCYTKLIEKVKYLACLLSLPFSYPYEHCRNLSFTTKKTYWEGKYFYVSDGLKQQEVSIWYDTWRPFEFWVYYQTPVQLLFQKHQVYTMAGLAGMIGSLQSSFTALAMKKRCQFSINPCRARFP